MRNLSASSISTSSGWKSILLRTSRILSQTTPSLSLLASRNLAQVRTEPFSELWFTASFPAYINTATTNKGEHTLRIDNHASTPGKFPDGKDHKPQDERTLKLGKTLRTLSPLLPDILRTPLPQDIISPNISLHLFPSTHPHLPIVKGRVPYRAALWTAPVAWGCMPIVGNVKLEILSEKMVRTGHVSAPTFIDTHSDSLGEEKLVVKWRTEQKKNGNESTGNNSATSMSSAADSGGINRGLSTMLGGDRQLFKSDAGSDVFSGLFIFSFDSKGRIASHTIEHTDENSSFDKTSKFVALTDWLLGKARWRNLKEEEEAMPVPGLAYKMRVCREITRKEEIWERRKS